MANTDPQFRSDAAILLWRIADQAYQSDSPDVERIVAALAALNGSSSDTIQQTLEVRNLV